VNIEELTAKMQHGTRKLPPQGKKPNAWTPDEDAILREHYPLGGYAAVTSRLERTEKAVCMRAKLLGIRSGKNPTKEWTMAEDHLLRKHYEAHGGAYVAQLTGRTVISVRYRASKLGVNADKSLAGKIRRRVQLDKARERRHGPKMTVVKAKEKPKVKQWEGEAVITKDTKITIAAPFVDKRWLPDVVKRVVNANECRAWATQV
jgi:hypothetical protein